MPVIRIEIVEGKTAEAIERISQAIHAAMLAAFNVPGRDLYQVITEHKSSHLVMQDTGLDIPRTDDRVLIQVISRPRSREQKEKFYELVCEALLRDCKIASTDVMISIVTNTDEDWSFGLGRAQFLTGDL